MFVKRHVVVFNRKDVTVFEKLKIDIVARAWYYSVHVTQRGSVSEYDTLSGKIGNTRFKPDCPGGYTKREVVAYDRRGVQNSMPWEKSVGIMIESFLSASQSQPFFNLVGKVLKEPCFHALIPW